MGLKKRHQHHVQGPRTLTLKLIGQIKGTRQPIEAVMRGNPEFRKLDPRDQGLTRSLVTGFFRHHHALDAAFAPHLSKGLEELSPAALGPLRMGCLELLGLKHEPHAALNEAVKLAPKSLKGLVNAVLRKVQTDPEAPARFWSTPAVPPWMAEAWEATYGEARTRDLLNGLRQIPDLDLTLKPGMVMEGREELAPNHARSPATDPRALPGFDAGDWWVQDLAASLPARMLGDVAGKRVLDVCAAPGGKTMQLAAAGANVTALDASESRLVRLQENLARTNLKAEVVCADALTYTPDALFDAILLDAPCSASGTLRRHPEWPWIHARKDQLSAVPLQAQLIDRALTWLKPAGVLVYAVCSLFPEEGEDHFAGRSDLIKDKPASIPALAWNTKKGWLRTTPNVDMNMDGFFAAAVRKT